MTGHRRFSELTAQFPAKRKERIAARASELKAAMALAELRQARALSQEELARILGVKQPAVAKLEKRADMYVSNLRRYVEAMGGTLEIYREVPRRGGYDHRFFRDWKCGRGGANMIFMRPLPAALRVSSWRKTLICKERGITPL